MNTSKDKDFRNNWRLAQSLWGPLPAHAREALRDLVTRARISVHAGDVIWLSGRWYITHSGLLRVAKRMRCSGIQTQLEARVSDPAAGRWVFKALVRRSRKTFTAYGDANPDNVSTVVRGAEMRVAETRAVDRVLRAACTIGVCSVEEIGSSTSPGSARKMPPQSANGNESYRSPKLRDLLCQLIREHRLDPNLVKSYAVDFCGTKTLREASREQVEAFVVHLSDWAEKDRDALLCQLNNYLPSSKKVVASANGKAGAA